MVRGVRRMCKPICAAGEILEAKMMAEMRGPQGVPLVQGSGRIASSTLTVHGFETKFKEEIDIADTLLLHHPV